GVSAHAGGSGAGPYFHAAHARRGVAHRSGNRRQSARAFGAAQGGGAHGCAVAGRRSVRVRRAAPAGPSTLAGAFMNIVRLLNVLAFVLLIGSAVSVYRIKYDAIFHAEDVARLERAIEAERTTIAVLTAEWAKRTRPDNIEALTRAHLGLTVSAA